MTNSTYSLFQVQDADRPMWVVANDYGDAVRRWAEVVANENDQKPEEVDPPQGIHFVCDGSELLLP